MCDESGKFEKIWGRSLLATPLRFWSIFGFLGSAVAVDSEVDVKIDHTWRAYRCIIS